MKAQIPVIIFKARPRNVLAISEPKNVQILFMPAISGHKWRRLVVHKAGVEIEFNKASDK